MLRPRCEVERSLQGLLHVHAFTQDNFAAVRPYKTDDLEQAERAAFTMD